MATQGQVIFKNSECIKETHIQTLEVECNGKIRLMLEYFNCILELGTGT